MLGYVKCEPGSLLVRRHALYRALYCGLCRSTRRHFGIASSPFHSYDFVFLAAVRLLVLETPYTVEKRICPTHPFRRRPMVADDPVLKDTAFCQLLLIREKMADDLADRDTPFLRRLVCRLWLPWLNGEIKRAGKKDESYRSLAAEMKRRFEDCRELEKENASLDDMCSDFADTLSLLSAFRCEGTAARILVGIGDKLGRFLYTLDALDDLERDKKRGAFNPVLARLEKTEDRSAVLNELDAVQRFYLREAELALALAEGDRELYAICENVLQRGMVAEEDRVLHKRKEQGS